MLVGPTERCPSCVGEAQRRVAWAPQRCPVTTVIDLLTIAPSALFRHPRRDRRISTQLRRREAAVSVMWRWCEHCRGTRRCPAPRPWRSIPCAGTTSISTKDPPRGHVDPTCRTFNDRTSYRRRRSCRSINVRFVSSGSSRAQRSNGICGRITTGDSAPALRRPPHERLGLRRPPMGPDDRLAPPPAATRHSLAADLRRDREAP